MPRPNVLVIAVDGLRASALGAYGNTWYRTPSLDRIAAQSVLCDWCFADSTELPLIYRGLWQSSAAIRPAIVGDPKWSLPAELNRLGYATKLISDAVQFAEYAATADFAEAMLFEPLLVPDIQEIEQTCAAGVLTEVLNFVEDEHPTRQPWFVWAHLNGFYGVWDAPHDLALSRVEEDDPAPVQSTAPPNCTVNREVQSDDIFAESCRYAAQVMTLDTLLEPLCEMIDGGAAGECMLVVLGTRGFPLGEHGQLGGVDTRLYSEQLHLPLLMRLPSAQGALARVSRLVSPADIPATILGVLDINHPPCDGLDFTRQFVDPQTPWRSLLLASGVDRELSIRTPAWYLRGADPGNPATAELFVKPDDRWEVNDIASRCPDIATELVALATAERKRVIDGEPFSLAALPTELVEPTC